MIAKFLGVRVWELARVAVHYQQEARVILQAQHEAKQHLLSEAIKAGAQNVEIYTAEW